MLLQVGNARGRVSMIVILVVLKISSSTIVSAWLSPHRRRIARRLPLSEKDGIHYSKRYIVQRRDIVQAPSSSSVSASSMQHDSTQVYRTLYPPSLPHSNGTLQVDDIHTLYYEIHGQGSLNALFLHGKNTTRNENKNQGIVIAVITPFADLLLFCAVDAIV